MRKLVMKMLATCFGMGVIASFPSMAQDFEGSGTITYSTGRAKTEPAEFFVSRAGAKWAITRVSPIQGEDPLKLGRKLRAVSEVMDDGSNIYQLTHFEEATKPFAYRDFSGAISNSWVGKIMRRGFPAYVFGQEPMILFYAFASSEYLDALSITSTNGINPIEILGTSDRRVPAKFFRMEDQLRLPREIVFLNHQSLTNAALVCGSFTNMGGFHLPLDVRYHAYARGQQMWSMHFRVTNLSHGCSQKAFAPKLPGKRILIEDFRFSNSHLAVPPVTMQSVEWPSLEQTRQQPSYQAIRQIDWRSVRPSVGGKKAALWVRVVFYGFILAGLITLLVLLLRQRTSAPAPTKKTSDQQ